MRILIAPDKFPGSLTAAQVADHLTTGLATAGIDTPLLPLADGSVDAGLDNLVDAVAGRNLLPRHHWDSPGFTHIYALSDYTDRDTAGDPHLTGELLTRTGHDIGHTATTTNINTLVRTGTHSTDV